MSENRATADGLQPHSEDATSDPFVCERCGDPLGIGYRFCSRTCYEEWRREDRPKPMTFEEMQAEMEGVLARLRTYPEETP